MWHQIFQARLAHYEKADIADFVMRYWLRSTQSGRIDFATHNLQNLISPHEGFQNWLQITSSGLRRVKYSSLGNYLILRKLHILELCSKISKAANFRRNYSDALINSVAAIDLRYTRGEKHTEKGHLRQLPSLSISLLNLGDPLCTQFPTGLLQKLEVWGNKSGKGVCCFFA